MTQLVLASASASRAALLRAADISFRIIPADLDEVSLTDGLQARGATTAEIAVRLAAEKALAVSRREPGALVLGGDTVVMFQGDLISKCPDMEAVKALLRRLSGKGHVLVSGAALARDGEVLWSHASPVRLTMRSFSDGFLAAYLVAEGEALLSTVGCYRFEGRGAQLFETVEGDYFSVLGLPLLPVLAALRKEGVVKS
jgi:septum formation protein